MNANIKNTEFFIKMKCDLKGYIYVMEKFGNFYPLDQIATLTFVPMDNICPCFLVYLRR